MVFPDGTPESTRAFAEEAGLSIPILSDPDRTLFQRWNQAGGTPSTTLIGRGVRVAEVDTSWHRAMLEEFFAEQ